jgi:hypothetical protein
MAWCQEKEKRVDMFYSKKEPECLMLQDIFK